jgi:PAS domain S-box-containing protein
MGGYSEVLSVFALVGAVSGGFLLAQTPGRRGSRLSAMLLLTAAWWALCQSRWNAASDPAEALLWMRLSTPGWAFLGGLLPHTVLRYFESYPASGDLRRHRSLLMRASIVGYSTGVLLVPFAFLTRMVHAELVQVPWGWSHAPGPAQLVFFAAAGGPMMLAAAVGFAGIRSPFAVAPPAQRIFLYLGFLIPGVSLLASEVLLPVMGVAFPRLGSISYAILGLLVLISGLRYGLSFFSPTHFSEEILDTLHEGVAMVTPTGLIRRANRGLLRLTGHPREVLVGMEIERLLVHMPESTLQSAEDEPTELAGADGTAIPVSLSAAPLRDLRENEMGLVLVVRDLREVQELRRRMVTQARLAAVGELAAGLAHEINNPLAFVRSNLGLLGQHVKSLADGQVPKAGEHDAIVQESHEIIHESLLGVDRAAKVVHGVRRFTEAGQPRREASDPNALIEDTLAMLRPQARSSQVSIDFHPAELPLLPCSPQDLRQVFLNLLVNALDAVNGKGRVEVRAQHADEEITVEISDDGCGMSPEIVERIFDPFFTTKDVGEGTGLGLAIAWHIVDAHAGHIEVESTPGVGTTFRVRLPVDSTASYL